MTMVNYFSERYNGHFPISILYFKWDFKENIIKAKYTTKMNNY